MTTGFLKRVSPQPWKSSCGASVLPNKNSSMAGVRLVSRSEEHTSELQSRSDLVCRLLLEKKKNNVVREAAITLGLIYLQLLSVSLCDEIINGPDTPYFDRHDKHTVHGQLGSSVPVGNSDS